MSWFKSFLAFFIFMIYFPTAQAQENKDALVVSDAPLEVQTTLIGHIRNAFPNDLDLRFFTDYISFDEQLFKIPVGIDHQFAITFLLKEPTVASLTYYGMEFPVYLEPGNELHIYFDALDLWGTLRFSGTGAIHNEYLIEENKTFGQWTTQSIAYEIGQRKPMDYRRLLDRIFERKQEFFSTYPDKEKFSPSFRDYAFFDIRYWWGYQLLRYRTEHPLANGFNAPMTLPQDYYSFLNNLLISNDAAIQNRNYLFFIDQYLSFRNENPTELNGSRFFLNSMEVIAPSMMVLAEPDNPPILAELKQGERVVYMEKRSDHKSKILINGAMVEDYWYKVRTANGIDGWVSGVGMKLDDLSNKPVNIDESGQAEYRNAEKLLKGKALSYTIANDIYWRSQISDAEILEPEVARFLENHQTFAYREVLKGAYRDAVKRKGLTMSPKSIYGSTNYLTVSQAQVLSRQGEKVMEPQPIIVPTKAQDVLPKSEEKKEERSVAVKTKQKKRKIRKPKKVYAKKNTNPKKKKKVETVAPIPIVVEKEKSEEKSTSIVRTEEEKVVLPEPTKNAVPKPSTVNKTQPNMVNNPKTYATIDAQPRSKADKFQTIKIKGSTSFTKELKLVVYEEPILMFEQEVKLKMTNATSANAAFKFGKVQCGYLSYGKEWIDLYFQKEGELQISFDGNNVLETIRFSGEGAEANNYLIAQKKVKKDIEEAMKKQMKDADPEGFKDFMNNQRKILNGFLKSYKKEHALDRQFFEFAKADIDYWYGYNLLNYLWEHPLSKGQDAPMYAPTSYFSFFETLMISNEFALPNLNYIYFLDQFFDYQSTLKSNREFSDKDLARKFLKGDPLDYYLAKSLSIECKRGKALEIGPEIQQFLAQCKNEVYNDVLRQVYNEAKGLSNGDMAPNFTLKDRTGKIVQLSDYKGKVVYIDFWATWCSPCVLQMRNSKQWKQEFAGRSDVVFLYLSLDKDTNAWRNFINSNSLDGYHLKADGGDVYKSKIARLYKVKRMPHAYLVDKDGKVAYNSATDSSTRRVGDVLRGLLD